MKRKRKTRPRKPSSRSIAIFTYSAGNRSFAPGFFRSPATRVLAACASCAIAARTRWTPETDEQTGDYTPAILTSWREIPTEALERKELGELLRAAIAGLPEIYRNVILLRDIEEMDVRETSAALGITEGAVKVRLHRARALLQKKPGSKVERICAQTQRPVWVGRMRIDCKHVWQYISAYIDGEIDAELRARIERHLETCEICSAVLDSTRNVIVLVADDRVFELPAGFSERLHARLDKEFLGGDVVDSKRFPDRHHYLPSKTGLEPTDQA